MGFAAAMRLPVFEEFIILGDDFMEYHVKHRETGEEKTLNHLEVNDMEYGDGSQIIVFDKALEAYVLLDDSE
ncbi:hypothetical protein BC351_32390 [Paenibacillus ferrarius]|uniref:Uncharacterized protein n=1 Tax=Paenibacillus ferrarius TaxID=1469647 RepID=A0A1V4HF81_9BACL|nr:hypothetical protein [Paenibacillus ferrarius]OPH52962.1 hypothetical protein BC351_32390 [Paenibacillus ferrarius]